MSMCLNPHGRHLYQEGGPGTLVCQEPGCGFLLQGAWLGWGYVVSLLKHSQSMDLYLVTQGGEQRAQGRRFLARVLRQANPMVFSYLKRLQRLQHPHLHPLLQVESVEQGRLCYVLTQFEEGGSLARYLDHHVALPFTAIAAIVHQMGEALQFAHEQNIVYGHFKPENCLLIAPATLQLCDLYYTFLGGALVDAFSPFTAPEQLQGQTAPASDQFALAALTYLLLKHCSPLASRQEAVAHGSAWRNRLLFPLVPLFARAHPLDQMLRRALHQNPVERFPNIYAFVSPFCSILEGLAEQPRPFSGERPASRPLLEHSTLYPALPGNAQPKPPSGKLPAPSGPLPGQRLPSGDLRFPALQPRRPSPLQTSSGASEVCLPKGLLQTCLLPGHTASISALAWRKREPLLASGSEDGEILLWVFQGHLGQLKGTLQGHQGKVLALSWSPDGNVLASASSDSALRIWNLDNPARVEHSWWGHDGDATTLDWSPDGTILASGGKDGTLRLWNRKGELLTKQAAHSGRGGIRCLAWSPDQLSIVTGGADRFLRVWNVASWHQEVEWEVHQDEVRRLEWNPDGRFLASTGGKKDPHIYLWDMRTMRLLVTIEEQQRESVGLFWSGDSSWMAACSADGTLRLWQTTSLAAQQKVVPLCQPISLDASPLLMAGTREENLLAVATQALSITVFEPRNDGKR
jgi:serine/threonine protein kinase